MVVVYKISSPDFESTRLHLPGTAWGYQILERLRYVGYTVESTDEPTHPDTRGPEELARRDALLAWADPF